MNYPRGLIRFTSQDQHENGATHFVRPRLFGYSFAVLAMLAAFVYVVGTRQPVSVDVIRDRGTSMYRISGDQVQNVYTVKINNMDRAAHSYDISVSGEGDYQIRGYRALELIEGEVFTVPVRVSVPKSDLKSSKNVIKVTVTAKDDPSISASEEASFIGPHID